MWFQVIATPIGIAMGALVALLWFRITPLRWSELTVTWSDFPLAFLSVIVVHELIHVSAHPQGGRSPHSILGLWPSQALFYAHFDGELRRNRLIAVLLMPLLVITVVPLLVAAAMQVTSERAALVSSLNAVCACGDVLFAAMAVSQIPASATVRNQGWRTLWKASGT